MAIVVEELMVIGWILYHTFRQNTAGSQTATRPDAKQQTLPSESVLPEGEELEAVPGRHPEASWTGYKNTNDTFANDLPLD